MAYVSFWLETAVSDDHNSHPSYPQQQTSNTQFKPTPYKGVLIKSQSGGCRITIKFAEMIEGKPHATH